MLSMLQVAVAMVIYACLMRQVISSKPVSITVTIKATIVTEALVAVVEAVGSYSPSRVDGGMVRH